MSRQVMISLATLISTFMALSAAQGQVVMFDHFEHYTAGTSINGLSPDPTPPVDGTSTWFAQRNSSVIGDHGWSTVVEIDGDNALQMINRDIDDQIDTVYTHNSFLDITDQGTVYLRFMNDGINDSIAALNGDLPGVDCGDGSSVNTGDCQGTNNYADQGSLAVLRSDDLFRARNGGAYENVSPTLSAMTWYEMWIHVDQTNAQVRYSYAPDGDTPTVITNSAGGDWWAYRSAQDSITSLKFFIGSQAEQTTLWIDTVGVDPSGFSLNSLADPTGGTSNQCGLRVTYGDFNCDGFVGLLDLDILGQNFDGPGGANQGDATGDGRISLLDLDVLGQNFNTYTQVPEPASISMLLIACFTVVRRW